MHSLCFLLCPVPKKGGAQDTWSGSWHQIRFIFYIILLYFKTDFIISIYLFFFYCFSALTGKRDLLVLWQSTYKHGTGMKMSTAPEEVYKNAPFRNLLKLLAIHIDMGILLWNDIKFKNNPTKAWSRPCCRAHMVCFQTRTGNHSSKWISNSGLGGFCRNHSFSKSQQIAGRSKDKEEERK